MTFPTPIHIVFDQTGTLIDPSKSSGKQETPTPLGANFDSVIQQVSSALGRHGVGLILSVVSGCPIGPFVQGIMQREPRLLATIKTPYTLQTNVHAGITAPIYLAKIRPAPLIIVGDNPEDPRRKGIYFASLTRTLRHAMETPPFVHYNSGMLPQEVANQIITHANHIIKARLPHGPGHQPPHQPAFQP